MLYNHLYRNVIRRVAPLLVVCLVASLVVLVQAAPAVPGETPPGYQNDAIPRDFLLSNLAGEPSIGVNWKTDKVFFQAYTGTFRVSYNDATVPATATWEDRSAAATEAKCTSAFVSADPILFTDPLTGRTFESQLIANPLGPNSLTCFTDDDGETWTPSTGGGPNSGLDHQSVGGGPYAMSGAPLPTTTYTHTVYYCSQDIADATCSRSDDGGLTFGLGVPIYSLLDCSGLHGHVKVAPNDGTVYVPNKDCNGKQAVAVSTANGTVNSWQVYRVPSSTTGRVDPSVGIGKNGTVYMGYQNGDGHPHAVVSHDQGKTWSDDTDIGAAFGIQNAVWPVAVAGDDDRAAIAFIGTPTGGDYEQYDENGPTNPTGDPTDPSKNFQGTWHLYIASTFDGGKTWVTADATPTDPVQRGSICTGGTTCGKNRNMLDFIDITVDRKGRALVAYADGCVDGYPSVDPATYPEGNCASGKSIPNTSFNQLATIARQTTGKRLFAQFDLPAAPTATATMPTVPSSTATAAPTSVQNTATAMAQPTATTPAATSLPVQRRLFLPIIVR